MIIFYIILFLTVLIQATLLNAIAIANVKPDLLLALVVFTALYRGWRQAAAVGIVAGFLADLLSTGPFVNTFVFAACGFLSGLFIEKFYFFKENIFVQFVVVFFASGLHTIVNLAWFWGLDNPPPIIVSALYIGIPSILYTSLASLGLFFVFKRILSDAA